MKLLPFFAIIVLGGLLASCGKENTSSGRELIGAWVDINHTADTLVFYNKEGKIILFDNSLSTRSIRLNGGSDRFSRFEVKLVDNKLVTRWLESPSQDGADWFAARFEWIRNKIEFKVEPNGFRPYLSCAGCPQQFRKIN